MAEGAGVVKVSHQQSKGVKCLSCLFTVNDGFDSLPKEQWEIRSEGHATGEDGRWRDKCLQGCNDVRVTLCLMGNFHATVCLCVFWEAAEALWSVVRAVQ